jgi:mono/diheme cytochrome c family protein
MTARSNRTARTGRNALILFILVLFGTGLVFAWPWSVDMVWQPILSPFEQLMFPPPPGTLPVHGGELRMDAQELRNPFPATSESLEQGKQLFLIYCAVCHGEDAKGGGTIGDRLLVAGTDLTLRRPDDYIYTHIRAGGPIMPGYAESLSPEETWAVVNYVRSLQAE